MYKKFFGLAEAPFNLTPDSRFLYLSQKHREALASLMYGIQERKGFITLTGEIGSGKTTLCRSLLNELDTESIRIAIIFNSYLTEVELLQTINEDFGIPSESDSKKDLIKNLNVFLLKENTAGHNIVLIIDEAQNLTVEVLEQIRMLSNLETETSKLIQIVLMGQPEFLDKLALLELEQLNQRIAVRYHIMPLEKEDIGYYIRHRLKVAKAQIDIDFSPGSIELIHEFSGGIPRKINVLCDRCLLSAYSRVTYSVDSTIVKESIKEIEGEKRAHKTAVSISGKSLLNLKNALYLLPVVFILIAASVYLGASLANKEYSPVSIKSIEAAGNHRKPSYLEKNSITDIRSESNINEKTVSVAPTPNSTPVKKKKRKPRPPHRYNWQFDNNNICRVNNSDYAYPASIITWLRLWNIEVDLKDFKNLDAATIKKLDLAENDQLGLKRIFLDNDINQAAKYDLPFIIIFDEAPDSMSPAVVLLRMEGVSLTIADPIRGLKSLKRSKIEDHISQCIVMYFDKTGVNGILRGEESDRVTKVQHYLKNNGFLKKEASGIFDSATTRAIRNFQKYNKLEVTGDLDEETLLVLCSRMQRMRPRLFSSGGED
jgi:general secretion pathway protein A